MIAFLVFTDRIICRRILAGLNIHFSSFPNQRSFPESTNYLLVSGQIARLEKLVLDIAHTNFPRNFESAAALGSNSFELEPSFDESIKVCLLEFS